MKSGPWISIIKAGLDLQYFAQWLKNPDIVSQAKIHTHTHTHTHTCNMYLFGPSTMDFNLEFVLQEFYMQSWTYTSEFSQMNTDFLCMCVKFYHGLPPTPTYKSIIGHVVFTCMPMRFSTEWQVSDNRGRPRLVCVHGSPWFFWWVSMVEGALIQTHTHILV